MKVIAILILALGLCGCQGLKQAGTHSSPGTMTTGNWEFVLQRSDTQNTYVESNIQNTSTAGSYNDHGGDSALFTFDPSVYFADPSAGGGYQLGPSVSSLTLNVDSQFNVTGTLNQNGTQPITFVGTIDAEGLNITGTFSDGSGNNSSFTASTVDSLGGYFSYAPVAITESISGSVISETSQYGSGDYNLTTPVGNFAFLAGDVPAGGDGSVVFWNNSGVCTDKQCAVWLNSSNRTLWVFQTDPGSGTSKVIGVLSPPA